jgi:hypothetical protein
MYIRSKALGFALVAAMVSFGVTGMQAKNHKDKNNQCQPKSEGCPAPVIQTPQVESSCCPIPQVVSRCAPPPQQGCCGVIDNSSKDIDDAHKEAMKAYHEATEACKKRQAAIAKAQHELAEKTAREQRRIDKANDHFNHELSELQERNAKYDAFFGPSSDTTPEAIFIVPQPQPVTPQPEVERSKPEPLPEPISEAPPQTVQEEQVAVLEVPSTPTTPTATETPRELPKTASPFNLIGLIGLASMSGYATRLLRR